MKPGNYFVPALVAVAACGSESIRSIESADTTVVTWHYEYDANGLTTAVQDGTGIHAVSPQRTDALGRATVRGDATLIYGPDGQIASATRGADVLTYVYDETGQRILKRTNGAVTAAYLEEGVLTASGLVEPVKIAGHVVGVVDRGAFALVASDVRGSALASTDGRGELPSPYGDRASHPDIAASIDYAQKGFDSDLGVVRMGVRDYDPKRNQFLEPDPLFLAKPENCVASPIECNLYGYAKSRPADHVDPSGTCSAPALEKGQVGTCFEAFIGAKWIGGIGRGDGRGFAANDPSLTARFTQRLVLDPAHGQILESNVSLHRSNVLLPGLGLKGFADELILPPYTDKDGAKHVDFSILAENGFFHLPGAPKDPIMAELGLRIGKDGRVDVTGGTRTAYPSMAMYSYRLDENGKLQTTTLFELKENKVSDLGHWGAMIPSTIQKR